MILNSNQISIYCDGGSRGNPGPSACAFVVKDQTGKILYQEGKYLGVVTNNVAEYNGVILALNYLKNNPQCLPVQSGVINFFLDSNLVVSQLNGIFKIKNSILRDLIFKIKILENEIIKNYALFCHSGFSPESIQITYFHIPREKNSDADFLVNKTLDSQGK